jgi:uncharacterized protein
MLISLQVTPKSSKNEIIGWVRDADGEPMLKVKVAAPPEDGKANRVLLKFLAKQWDISASQLELVSGLTSRHKRLKLHSPELYTRLVNGQQK